MALVDEFWSSIYNAFDPWRPLFGKELELYFVPRTDLPPENNPLYGMRVEFTESRLPLKILLTGHRGSGKTSALADLVNQLGDQFFVVWLDVERNTDIFNVNHVEVLFLMGVVAFKVAEAALEKKPDRALLDSMVDSLNTLVQEQTGKGEFKIDVDKILDNVVSFGLGFAAALPSPITATMTGLALALKGVRFTLGLSEETVRKLEVKPKISEIAAKLNDLLAEIQQKADRRILFIVDGLDKVEVEQARAIFAESLVLREPLCHMVYTAPILLYYSTDFSGARQLFTTYEFPNVRLHERGNRDKLNSKGYELMRQVVYKRLRALELVPGDVIWEGALNNLITKSGGVMRELISLMRDACVKARLMGRAMIDEEIAEKAIYSSRRKYAAGLSEPYFEELKKVLELGMPTGSEICDKLLQNLYVLGYANYDLWYDVHPNVLPLITGVE